MIIMDNNYKGSSDKTCNFRAEFKDTHKCTKVAESIKLLTEDDTQNALQKFHGTFGEMLFTHALEGLIVFLSCEQVDNTLSGQFSSLDLDSDGQLFKEYITEANDEVIVDIIEHTIAA